MDGARAPFPTRGTADVDIQAFLLGIGFTYLLSFLFVLLMIPITTGNQPRVRRASRGADPTASRYLPFAAHPRGASIDRENCYALSLFRIVSDGGLDEAPFIGKQKMVSDGIIVWSGSLYFGDDMPPPARWVAVMEA
jgi:hypothetical protein